MRDRRRVQRVLLGLAACLGIAGPTVAQAGGGLDFGLHDPTYVMIGVGGWEVARDTLRKPEVDIVLRPAHHLWILKPEIGLTVAGDGDVLAYAGPMVDYYFTPSIVGTISTSVGVWTGSGFNLGSRIEFHSGGEIAYRFDDASRLGFGIFHTSNADITKRNPGSESLLVEYSIPIRLGR